MTSDWPRIPAAAGAVVAGVRTLSVDLQGALYSQLGEIVRTSVQSSILQAITSLRNHMVTLGLLALYVGYLNY